jgi:hypothetical protein
MVLDCISVGFEYTCNRRPHAFSGTNSVFRGRSYCITVLALYVLLDFRRSQWAYGPLAPVYKDIDLHLDPVLQNGTIWYDADNIFRRDPSPEVDAAWGNLSHDFHVAISKSEWIKMGLPADKGVKWEGDPTGQTYAGEIVAGHAESEIHL